VYVQKWEVQEVKAEATSNAVLWADKGLIFIY